MRRALVWGQFWRFLIAGLVNTATTVLLFELLRRVLSYQLAYTIVYAFGILLSYILSSRLVFATGPSLETALRFPAVYIVQYLLGMSLLWLLIDIVNLHPTLGLLIAITCNIPVTFFLMRWAMLPARGSAGR